MSISERKCRDRETCRLDNGNCSVAGQDGLPVQCVGSWAEHKYYFLERYLDATKEARKKFAEKGNAVYIDLFSGSGVCVIRDENREIDGGALRILNIKNVKFNEYHFFDIDKENTDALKVRSDKLKQAGVNITCGDSNELIDSLVCLLKKRPYRYHFVYIDPFGPDGLKFNTIRKLAELDRVDLFIHFPIGSIKRNIGAWTKKDKQTILDDFFGTTEWRDVIKKSSTHELTEIFKDQLLKVGFSEEGLRYSDDIYSSLPTVTIRNEKEAPLYTLILASKHKIAQKIWNSVIKISPTGEKSLF